MGIKRFDVGEWLDSPLSRRRLDLSHLERERAVVQEICARVAAEGDAALREYGQRFDGWSPAADGGFDVPRAELERAWRRLPPEDRRALEFAARRIREFHSAQTYPDSVGPPGLKLLTRPVRRVGAYVPGGRAAYPSTLLMTVIPARIAGVAEVVVATPPRADGTVPTAILAAARLAEADAVYRLGGAQAIAALAYGTISIPRADVVVGPGNIYVTLAKREVFGQVGVDGIQGPTEILIVADDEAPPEYLAADLASQLEHDPLAWAVLVTDSPRLADAVEAALAKLLAGLERAEIATAAHCCLILVDSIEQALEVANDFGPEHMELVVRDAGRWASGVENAGAVFLGPYGAVSLGDYVVGTNHTLPTAGSARFGSPLGVHTFLRRASVASLTQGDLEMLQEAARTLARLEGLGAHAHAVEVRLAGRGGPDA
ncbi:MAG TPA: histidinol dehydrogenase [Candidatus Acidoferrales bacterium]|nr:histidinol dehydrogenase [Candidatus Acidoferrales bacterium]